MHLQSIKALTPIEEIRTLKEIDTLQHIKPIYKVPNIPSEMELIYLSTNLLYKASLILRDEATAPKNLNIQDYTDKAIALHSIINNYEERYLTLDEMKDIRKDFKLNEIYNAG